MSALRVALMRGRLLVITGAGYSRNLGGADPLPLMGEWAEIMRGRCDGVERGLADALGLKLGLGPVEFEEVMGSLLALDASLPLFQQFMGLGAEPIGRPNNHHQSWEKLTRRRLSDMVRVLHETLYEQFGRRAIDSGKAKAEVEILLDHLEGTEDVVFATTNYDQSIEIGLDAAGSSVTDGFPPIRWGSSSLQPDLLTNWPGESNPMVPVLHLHGAVGWYAQSDGAIISQPPDQAYNDTLGVPAVLPPDPNKSPLSNPFVAEVWRVFRLLLSQSKKVLVLGHSLHDPALVSAIGRSSDIADVAVGFHRVDGDDSDRQDDDPLPSDLADATRIPTELGPEPVFGEELDRWLS